MSRAVALYGYCNGEHTYMRGRNLNGASERGMFSAQTLRAYTERVYFVKYALFEFSNFRIRRILTAFTE